MDAARKVLRPQFKRFRGDTKQLEFTLTDDNGTIVPPSGCELFFHIEPQGGGAALVEKRSSVGGFLITDDAAGKFSVKMVPDDDAALANDTTYDLVVVGQILATGDICRVVGTIELQDGILDAPAITIDQNTDNPAISWDLGQLVADRRTAAEALGSSSFVAITAGGVFQSDSDGLPAHGFVREATIAGATAAVRTAGSLNGFAGLAPGVTYYLGHSGQPTAVPPSSGLLQVLGVATAADTLLVNLGEPVVLD